MMVAAQMRADAARLQPIGERVEEVGDDDRGDERQQDILQQAQW